MLKFTLPPVPIGDRIINRLQNIAPVIDDSGSMHVKDLQDNIVNEGGDPDTGAAWKALSQPYLEHKRMMGYFLTILRRTDAMRKGITVISKDGNSYRISVTGDAKKYFAFVNEKRKFLGLSPETRMKIKLRLSKHLKG